MKSVFKTLDRNRPRKMVFYGRVSTEHEAQLAALKIRCNGTMTRSAIIPIGQWWIDILMKELQARKQKSALLS